MAKKYLSLERLAEYDALIKAKIDTVAEAKPDWNQNDANALDYVKNRTHWVEQEVEIVVPATTDMEYSYNAGSMWEVKADINSTYIVTLDGTTYQCTPWPNSFGEFCLGDSRLTTTWNDDGEEVVDTTHPEDVPFHVNSYFDDDGSGWGAITEYWYFTYPDSETHTIEIAVLSDGNLVYHTLDERFIPDAIARKEYVDNIPKVYYGVCNTLASNADKIVSIDNFKLVKGVVVAIKFALPNDNKSATLNISGTGAKPMYQYGTTACIWNNYNSVKAFVYDGSSWMACSRDTTAGSLGYGVGYCYTDESILIKDAYVADYHKVDGGIIHIWFENNVPSGASLNISGTGAHLIYYADSSAIRDGVIKAGDTATFKYQGAAYSLLSVDRLCKDIVDLKEYVDAKIAEIPSSDVTAITTTEIDAICGASVVAASEVTF